MLKLGFEQEYSGAACLFLLALLLLLLLFAVDFWQAIAFCLTLLAASEASALGAIIVSRMSRMLTGCSPPDDLLGSIWNLVCMNSSMSLEIASLLVSTLFSCARQFSKSRISFFSTLFMWSPEPQMVRAGKGTSETSLVVFLRIVTT